MLSYEDIDYSRKNDFLEVSIKQIIFPFCILTVGIIISIIVFVLEIIIKKYFDKGFDKDYEREFFKREKQLRKWRNTITM